MSDTLSAVRLEPSLTPPPGTGRPDDRVIEIAPASSPVAAPARIEPFDPGPPVPATAPEPMGEGGLDQLSRIEDKTARIEEKYARSEARMQRVVDKVDAAMDRMSNVALQSDLMAIRGEIGLVSRRLKGLPKLGGLLLTSVLTAILTAAVIIALVRYGGVVLQPR